LWRVNDVSEGGGNGSAPLLFRDHIVKAGGILVFRSRVVKPALVFVFFSGSVAYSPFCGFSAVLKLLALFPKPLLLSILVRVTLAVPITFDDRLL
jgi:hypothetical protein